MTYLEAMAAGRQSLAHGDFNAAYTYYGQAHGLGHTKLSQHLSAHRGMLRAAWRGRKPGRVCSQLFLMGAALVITRDHSAG
jgi:hypothetical protein